MSDALELMQSAGMGLRVAYVPNEMHTRNINLPKAKAA